MNNYKSQKKYNAPKKQETKVGGNEFKNLTKSFLSQKQWRYVFLGVSSLIFIWLLFLAMNSGATGDEPLDGANGKYALEYYTNGDTTFADYSKVPEVKIPFLKYYGVGFEIIPAIFTKYFGLSTNLYTFRHILGALFGFIFMLFAALTAKKLKNWQVACITMVVMTLTPVILGHSIYSSKDIPFATGFSIAIYGFICFYKALPDFKWKYIIISIIGIAVAISIRIGGFMLIGYFGVGLIFVYIFRKDLKLFKKPYNRFFKLAWISLLIIIAGCFLGLCFYPNFFYEGPITHIKNAFVLVSKFPQRIPMLYEGNMIDSLNLPSNYLMKNLLITIPIFAIIAFILSIFNIKTIYKNYDKTAISLLLFTVIFPIFYIIYSKAYIYNGWRHISFFYSSFAILASIGLYETYFWWKKKKLFKIWKISYAAMIILLAFPVLVWSVRNYHYPLAYYNAFISKPYLNYDLDAPEVSCVIAYDWLVKNEIKDRKDTVVIGVKNINAVHYQEIKKYPNVKVKQTSFRGFAETDEDYTILSMQFIPKNILKQFFPPKGTIHTENVDGNPICAVVKRNKLDSKGIQLVKEGSFKEGMDLLEKAYAFDPNNFGIWFWMGYGYYNQGDFKNAINFFNQAVNFWPTQDQVISSKMYTGLSLIGLGEFRQAIPALKDASQYTNDQNRLFIEANLGVAYYNIGEYSNALPYLQKTAPYFPNINALLQDTYKMLGYNK